MFEPQNISSEMVALGLLAGSNLQGEPLIKPGDLTHLVQAGSTLWPPAGANTVTLFNYAPPSGNCLLVTYLSLYTTEADESSLQINFGFNYDALAQLIYYQTGTADFRPQTGQLNANYFFNRPLMLLVPPETVFQVRLTANSSTQTVFSVRAEAAMHGYLLSAGLINVFKPYQTRFA